MYNALLRLKNIHCQINSLQTLFMLGLKHELTSLTARNKFIHCVKYI